MGDLGHKINKIQKAKNLTGLLYLIFLDQEDTTIFFNLYFIKLLPII